MSGKDLSEIQTKLGILLERTEGLPDLVQTVSRHSEKWENMEESIVPAIKKKFEGVDLELEEGKKFRWLAAGAGGVLGFFAEWLDKHFG